jgi:hypothetical protein
MGPSWESYSASRSATVAEDVARRAFDLGPVCPGPNLRDPEGSPDDAADGQALYQNREHHDDVGGRNQNGANAASPRATPRMPRKTTTPTPSLNRDSPAMLIDNDFGAPAC